MAVTKILAACMMLASQTYDVPPALLAGIYKAEGGKVGQQVKNTNGSFDLGPMQINTIWLPQLAREWGVSKKNRTPACARPMPVPMSIVAAWILRGHIDETRSLSKALEHYHSRTPQYGKKI